MSILDTIDRLSRLTYLDLQSSWWISDGDGTPLEPVELNEKKAIIWPKGGEVRYFTLKITVPEENEGYFLEGMELRLILTWWADNARIYVNGELVGEGDLFDSSTRVLLSPSVSAGQTIDILLRLVSPGHDIGGLMKSALLYERSGGIDPYFVANELKILHNYLKEFEPEKLTELNEIPKGVEWNRINRALVYLRRNAEKLALNLKNRTFHLLGHAHLDMAWLWPLKETWGIAANTFTSVLNLRSDYPALKFGHSSPIIYDWLEKNQKSLFDAVLEAYKAGAWEILGGMWVEPEVNLISGESLIRQLLYGQRYFTAKFGSITRVAWLPDTFGFPYQLPQILKGCGIDYFVTAKLHWNDTNKFPHGYFRWRSPDGTEILSLMSPPNVAGVMDTNPIVMTDHAINWERQTGLKEIFWLPGVGDHGGGPTRDMLEVGERWRNSPFFPKLQFTRAVDYLDSLPTDSLPVWDDELYLEFHRGCYTTHADQKAYNRYCEFLLYQGELWSSLGNILLNTPYPKEEIEENWKKVLLNQFHDILPGTSIPEVFEEANRTWSEVIDSGERMLSGVLRAICGAISLPVPPREDCKPIVVFNSLNWVRSSPVFLKGEVFNEVRDIEGNSIPCQRTAGGETVFIAPDLPPVGYRVFWLCPAGGEIEGEGGENDFILENDYLKVRINPETGDIDSIIDKIRVRELLSGAGNRLQLFRDRGQYWDAWNIDPDYESYPLAVPVLKSITSIESGSVRTVIRVVRVWGNSEFTQDYILYSYSPLLTIDTSVNWQEEGVLVKVAFPWNLESDVTTYEIACGAIERDNRERGAKWEVYGHKWADLTDVSLDYGVSFLNNCKYGYDGKPNLTRLTLLRGTRWPDRGADRGYHRFSYAIYPHNGDWKEARTVYRGYEFNLPPVCIGDFSTGKPILPPSGSCLDTGGDSFILMALKRSEDDNSKWILRGYECHGGETRLEMSGYAGLRLEGRRDGLERELGGEDLDIVKGWKIASYLATVPEKSD